MRIVRLLIHGRVQGIGFRAFVEDRAFATGVEGWVRNRLDGSVEVVVTGEEAAMEAMLAALRQGPPVARIDRVEILRATENDLRMRPQGEKFSVLRTG
ncbi:MAG TPA: acylphosphatase [Xanthobacteraceae bacterium]|nr:acylphosphatase [Xanthobacteraceae bacterium]